MSIVLELFAFNRFSNFHREGNKGKQIQTTTNCYIPNQTLANKVANIILNEISNEEQETS